MSIAQVLTSPCTALESARDDLPADVLGAEHEEDTVDHPADQGELVALAPCVVNRAHESLCLRTLNNKHTLHGIRKVGLEEITVSV